MKRLLVLLVALVSLSTFAQSGSEQLPLPDSLVVRLKEYRKTDAARANHVGKTSRMRFDTGRFRPKWVCQ